MKSISEIHTAITKCTENMLVKCAPHTSMRESYNTSISAMLNPFHNIISSKKCLCDLYVSKWRYYMPIANRHLRMYTQLWRKNGEVNHYLHSYICSYITYKFDRSFYLTTGINKINVSLQRLLWCYFILLNQVC